MTILTVGAGEQFQHIADAINASHDGDVIQVQAGVYVNDFATVNTKITIEGVGGVATLLATQQPPDGKAILTENTDLTIDHLAFAGTVVDDNNGAGIRYQGGNLTITNSDFYDNEDGILGSPGAPGTGTVRISSSEFSHNGAGDGYSHNIYIGNVASLVIDNSDFHDSVVGHEIKSRALSTTVTNSRIYDGPAGTGSYSIDTPNGGVVLINNNIIEQGPNSQNPAIIAFGEEGNVPAGSKLSVTGNTILNDLTNGYPSGVWNASSAPATVSNNSVYGLYNNRVLVGAGTSTGTTFLTTEPTLDTSSSFAPTGAADTITVHVAEDAYNGDAQFTIDVDGEPLPGTYTATALHSSGRSQAFSVSGNWGSGPLIVGINYLNDASAPAGQSGDRNLYVTGIDRNGVSVAGATSNQYAPGTVDFLLPGSATTPVAPPSPPVGSSTLVLTLAEDAYAGDAQFTATVDGVSLGAAQSVTASHGAGASQAFTFNGNWAVGAHTVGVSFINDAYGGSGLDRNLYIDSVSLNGTPGSMTNVPLFSNGTASFATTVGQPAAAAPIGTDTLVLGLSEDAWNGDAKFTVSVDGQQQGAVQSVTALHAAGQSQAFTVTGQFGAGAHHVGVSFINDAYGGPGMDRNLYVNAVTFDGVADPAGKASLFSNSTATFTETSATPVTTDTLALNLSEDAYAGNAQFTLSIDGGQQGPAQSVTALHGLGQSQAFNFGGSFGAGHHDVAISFINDAYQSAGADRNLYVNSIAYDGTNYPAATGALFTNGTLHFTIGSTT